MVIMPTIKLTEVVSFSSEDPNHPAENLLRSDTFRKWKCAPGTVDKQSSVIMKLERLSSIHSIDIGNEGSAFVEVLVGREGAGDFQLLLVASSFMSPIESRNSSDMNRVRLFGPDKLNKNVASQKWDRIKVICTQPFNKIMQYGLSFITVRAPGEEPAASLSKVTKLGSFTLKEEDDSDPIAIGSMFARRKEKDSSPLSGAAAIRAASAVAAASSISQGAVKRKAQDPSPDVGFYQLKKKADSEKDPGKVSTLTKSAEPPPSYTTHKRDKNDGRDRDRQKKDELKPDRKEVRHKSSENSGKNREERNKTKNNREERKTDKPSSSTSLATVSDRMKRKTKPFGSLMDNVVFVLSGYQNPQRSQLRDMMLEMGANYKGDWGPGCTHLICAFINTPKYQQVKGRGKIVTAKWVTDCHRNKIRYPYSRYELEKGHGQKETEEEIWADELFPQISKPDAKPASPMSFAATTVPDEHDYDLDTDMSDNENTDDEIERVLARQKKNEDFSSNTSSSKDTRPNNNRMTKNDSKADPKMKLKKDKEEILLNNGKETQVTKAEQNTRVANGTMVSSEDEIYDDDTDVDEDNLKYLKPPDTSDMPLPPLGDYFKGKCFLIYGKMAEEKKQLLHRYIIAFNGDMEEYMSEKVQFVITEDSWDKHFDEALNENSSLQFVKASWIWRCSDKQKLVPHQPFLIVPRE